MGCHGDKITNMICLSSRCRSGDFVCWVFCVNASLGSRSKAFWITTSTLRRKVRGMGMKVFAGFTWNCLCSVVQRFCHSERTSWSSRPSPMCCRIWSVRLMWSEISLPCCSMTGACLVWTCGWNRLHAYGLDHFWLQGYHLTTPFHPMASTYFMRRANPTISPAPLIIS